MNISMTGLPWYEAESYERVCALMHDADRLFPTYSEWLAAAQRTEERLGKDGVRTVRVPLDLVQFPAWCAAHRPGLHIDAEARMQYASYVAAQVQRAGQAGTPH